MSKNEAKIIFTIGHSEHRLTDFLDLLSQHRISAVADVRSQPYSRFSPHFNRDQLRQSLKSAGIRYVFMGQELGARRSEPECYSEGKARYDLIAKTPLFREGMARIQNGACKFRLALMCAEKDPVTCHRAILICRYLRPLSFRISHILDNGQLETNEAMERRLLKTIRMDGGDLFNTESEAIEQAYDIQGARIAFAKNSVPTGEGD